MKKLNVVIRYILYLLPFIYLAYACIVYKTTGSNDALTLYDDVMRTLRTTMRTHPFFSGFYNWFNNNISNQSDFINTALCYCFYMLLVEFVLIIKNVLMYLFNVANAWLEKGVDLGK